MLIVLALYLVWKTKTNWRGGLYIRSDEIDLATGMRILDDLHQDTITPEKTLRNLPNRIWGALF